MHLICLSAVRPYTTSKTTLNSNNFKFVINVDYSVVPSMGELVCNAKCLMNERLMNVRRLELERRRGKSPPVIL